MGSKYEAECDAGMRELRKIRDEFYEITKGMSWEEKMAFIEKGAEETRRRIAALPDDTEFPFGDEASCEE